jgi:hypothetical protein
MKPLGPAIASILALAASGSPPPASAWYTSGSNLPSRRPKAACTSAKGLSAVSRTWSPENRNSVMAVPPGMGRAGAGASPDAGACVCS